MTQYSLNSDKINYDRENRFSSPDKDEVVNRFFVRLARALVTGDTETLKELWGLPSFMMTDGMVYALEKPLEIERFFSGTKDFYQARGIKHVHAQIQSLNWITERMVIADIVWPYRGERKEELDSETATYVLRIDESGEIKLYVALMHGLTRPKISQ